MGDSNMRSKENPFSFKNFLKTNPDGDSSPIRRRKKDDGSEDSDNPFSFHKFLNQGKSPEIRQSQSHAGNISTTSSCDSENFASGVPFRTSGSSIVTEFHFPQELPDFIQDHLEQVSRNSAKEKQSLNVTQSSLSEPYSEDLHNSLSNCDHLEVSPGSFSDTFATESYEGDSGSENKSKLADDTTYSLPDFISGTVQSDFVLPSCSFEDSSNSAHLKTSVDDDVQVLREENTLLKRQLQEALSDSERCCERISALEDQLKELTDKETQETAALEKMVQQVEYNLQVTTERAIKAEAQVSKLKQEMKLLQAQLKSMAKENERLTSSCSLVERDVIAEKADSIALQIKAAADNAEEPLRTMMEGLENLRLLSSLVADIGKIQETD